MNETQLLHFTNDKSQAQQGLSKMTELVSEVRLECKTFKCSVKAQGS